MSPKKPPGPKKKRNNRILACLDVQWRNKQNSTLKVAVVSVDSKQLSRKRRAVFNDTSDDTVTRVLGHNYTEEVVSPVKGPVIDFSVPMESTLTENETIECVDSQMEIETPASTLEKSVTNLFVSEETTEKITGLSASKGAKEVDKSYVLLPWQGITDLIVANFRCRECNSSIPSESITKVQVGMATSVNFFCENKECRHIGQLPAETRKGFKDPRVNKEPKKYATAHRNSDYSINLKMVLAMQQLGCGQAGAAVVGGMLSIAPNVFNGKWSALEEEIAKIQTTLGETIIDENVEKEKQLSEQNTAGQYLFCVSIDAGWNNTVGNRSGLVVALHYMSRRCAKCEIGELQDKDNPHDKSVCSRNYTGSSKGMEAHGALKSCLHLHLNRNVVWEIMVMDDDSSTQNLLRWNFAEAIDKQMMTEVPLTKGGNKREDKGQLPLSHPEITRLADHNHRNRCMAGKCYNLAYAKKAKVSAPLLTLNA
jgi:hypothetical protein